jgi:hypothetical protein
VIDVEHWAEIRRLHFVVYLSIRISRYWRSTLLSVAARKSPLVARKGSAPS